MLLSVIRDRLMISNQKDTGLLLRLSLRFLKQKDRHQNKISKENDIFRCIDEYKAQTYDLVSYNTASYNVS